MEGEKFHISLVDDAVPFCIKAPHLRTYKNKLKAELEILQEQSIIAPVMQVTKWCAPIHPRKVQIRSRCA